eukprot:10245761-Alexandrium_andersonii.AAC.1
MCIRDSPGSASRGRRTPDSTSGRPWPAKQPGHRQGRQRKKAVGLIARVAVGRPIRARRRPGAASRGRRP